MRWDTAFIALRAKLSRKSTKFLCEIVYMCGCWPRRKCGYLSLKKIIITRGRMPTKGSVSRTKPLITMTESKGSCSNILPHLWGWDWELEDKARHTSTQMTSRSSCMGSTWCDGSIDLLFIFIISKNAVSFVTTLAASQMLQLLFKGLWTSFSASSQL